jgi:predicted RND superfamily exporter protein
LFTEERILRAIRLGVLRAFRFTHRHHRLTLAVFAVAACALTFLAPPLKTMIRFSDLLEAGTPLYERERVLEDEFTSKNQVYVLFHAKDPGGFSEADLCRINGWMYEAFAGNIEIARVSSAFEVRRAQTEVGPSPTLTYPRILALNCANPATTPAGKALLAPVLDSPWRNVLVDDSGRDFATVFNFRDTPGGSSFGRFDTKPVGKLNRDLVRAFGGQDAKVDYWITGATGFLWYMQENITRESTLNVICMAILAVLFYLIYGTWRGGFLILTVNVMMAIFLFAAMALVGDAQDMLSKNLFVIVSIAGIQDFLFLAHDRQRTAKSGGTWAGSFRRLAVPALFTTLTTVLGFGSLCVSDFTMISRFGKWAAAGASIEWLVVFFFLPSLFKAWPWIGRIVSDKPLLSLDALRRLTVRTPSKPIVLLLVATFCVSLSGIAVLAPNDSLKQVFLADHPFVSGVKHIIAAHNWEAPLDLVFTRADRQAENEAILAKLRAHPNVVTVESPYQFLQYVTAPAAPELKGLVREEMAGSDAYQDYFSASGKAKGSLYLKDGTVKGIAQTMHEVEALCGDRCFVAGDMTTYARFGNDILGTLVSSFALSIVLVLGVLLFLNRALRTNGFWALAMSTLWGPVIVIGLFALCGVDINFGTAMFAAILTGLAGDNAIQFMFASAHQPLSSGIHRRGEGAVHVTIFMVGMISTFFFSHFRGPREFGSIFIAGILACLVGDLWLLSGFLSLFKPGSAWSRTRPAPAGRADNRRPRPPQ